MKMPPPKPSQRALAAAIGTPTKVAMREDLLRQFVPKGARLAEIGVFEGAHAQAMLDICAPEALHLIDVFEGVHVCGNVDYQDIRQRDMGAVYLELWRRFDRHPAVRLHKGTSAVLATFPEGSLDFVYIDADHRYEAVQADLRAAARVATLIGGHDYAEQDFPGVFRAVREFCWAEGWTMVGLSSERLPSYILRRRA